MQHTDADSGNGQLVIKPVPQRQSTIYFILLVNVAMWITVAAQGNLGSQLPEGFLFSAFFGLLVFITYAWTRLIVTPSDVVARDAGMRTARVLRTEIATIRRDAFWITFRDDRDRIRLRIQPYYTGEQLQQLARELGVPFVDHANRRGLRGRLLA